MRGLNRWESFKAGTNLRAWLLRIATNAFLDQKRKAQVRKVNPLPEDLPDQATPANSPLELAEQGDVIRAAMQDLTELTRLVFHLRVTEELPFREIAEIAGITEEAARWHMHQARAKLLKRLGETLS